MGLFGGKENRGSASARGKERAVRHSSGWGQLLKNLQQQESLRVLDFGATSPANINFLTGLGHSIYMANLALDAANGSWAQTGPDGTEGYDLARFLQDNLNFAGRTFDVVLLWDTLDFLPAQLLQSTVNRLYEVLVPGGQLLALFHTKAEGHLNRYHLREGTELEVEPVSDLAVRSAFSNRQIEKMFEAYTTYKFLLAKDNLREILVTR